MTPMFTMICAFVVLFVVMVGTPGLKPIYDVREGGNRLWALFLATLAHGGLMVGRYFLVMVVLRFPGEKIGLLLLMTIAYLFFEPENPNPGLSYRRRLRFEPKNGKWAALILNIFWVEWKSWTTAFVVLLAALGGKGSVLAVVLLSWGYAFIFTAATIWSEDKMVDARRKNTKIIFPLCILLLWFREFLL